MDTCTIQFSRTEELTFSGRLGQQRLAAPPFDSSDSTRLTEHVQLFYRESFSFESLSGFALRRAVSTCWTLLISPSVSSLS